MSKKEKSKNSKKARNTFFALSAGTALLLTGGLLTACDNGVAVTNVAFYSGTENPTAEQGKVGDFYFETDTCFLWQYKNEGWEVVSSLKGPKGDQGEKGEDGQDGLDGLNGRPGKSAYEIAVDLGYSGTIDEWIDSLKGRGILEVQKSTEGNVDTYTIYYTDSTSYQFSVTNGQSGTSGSQIYNGIGAPGSELGVNGDYYFRLDTKELYSKANGEWGNPTSLKGEQGDPGVDGVGISDFNLEVNEIGIVYTISYTQGQSSDRFIMAGNDETYKLKRGTPITTDTTTLPGMVIYTFTTIDDQVISLVNVEDYGVARYFAVASAQELQVAVTTGGVVNVTTNIGGIAPLNMAKDVMMLLNGNTLTFASTDTYLIRNEAGNSLMIMGGEISYTSEVTITSSSTSFINNYGQMMITGVDIELNNIVGHSADEDHKTEAVGRIDGIANWGAGEVSISNCNITMDTNVDNASNKYQYKTCAIFNLGVGFELIDSTLSVEINANNSSYAIYNYINNGEPGVGMRAMRIVGSTINATSSVINSLSGIFSESYEAGEDRAVVQIGEGTVVNVERTALSGSGKKTYALRAKGNAIITGAGNATLTIVDPTECTPLYAAMETNTEPGTGSYGMTGYIDIAWDGVSSTIPEEQAGVVTISTAAELAGLAQSVNEGNTYEGKTILLTSNLYLNGHTWTPIGEGGYRVTNQTAVFKGTFDGQDHTIYGLTNAGYNPTSFEYVAGKEGQYTFGLFGVVDGATIQNLTVADVNISGNIDGAGAIVGYSKGNLTVTNCHNLGGSITGYTCVAGVVGRAYNNSAVDGTGITVINCSNAANITGTLQTAGVVGYTVGSLTSNGFILVDQCSNSGTIYGLGQTTINANTGSFIAGIVTYGYYNGFTDDITITNNSNSGTIKQAYAHDIAFVATGAGLDRVAAENDVYDFTGNTNTGTSIIENLDDASLDWYKPAGEHPVVIVIDGQRPITNIYYEDVVTYRVDYVEANNTTNKD